MISPFRSLLAAVAFAGAAFSSAASTPLIPMPVRISTVLDGDTVLVEGRKASVRLSSIDAPERAHGRGRPGQPFSVVATDFLRQRIENVAGVSMVCMDADKYGRDVCELFLGGVSLNREMVRAGMAWANTSAHGRYMRDPELLSLQASAQQRRAGLWAQSATAPWEWRDVCWIKQVCLIQSP